MPRSRQQAQPPTAAPPQPAAANTPTGQIAALPAGELLPLAAVAGVAAAVPVAGAALLAAAAKALAAILAAFDAFELKRKREVAVRLTQTLSTVYPERTPQEIDKLVREEIARDREFRDRQRARLERDLPEALRIEDGKKRREGVVRIVERERRYTQMREQAMADRAGARANHLSVKAQSPDGAYWRLSDHVREHTPDCVAMGNKFWPWDVLTVYHPKLHPGCACSLLTKAQAVESGLMDESQVPDVKDAIRRAKEIIRRYGSLHEAGVTQAEIDDHLDEIYALSVEEALVIHRASKALRYPKGYSKGGQFRPKRGGDPGARRMAKRVLTDLLPHKPVSPAQVARDHVGEWKDIAGRRVFVPEGRAFEREVGGKWFYSPPGSTHVYERTKLLKDKPKLTPERGAEITDTMRMIQRDQQDEAAAVAGRALDSPQLSDRHPAAIHAPAKATHAGMVKAGFVQRGQEIDTGKSDVTIRYTHPQSGAHAAIRYADGKVAAVDWQTGVVALMQAPLLTGRPPDSLDEFVTDVFSHMQEVAKGAGRDVSINRFITDPALDDHKAYHHWDGTIELGRDIRPAVEAAARAHAAGRPLTRAEARDLYSSVRTAAHEGLHGINPISQREFTRPSSRALEEALTDEVAHAEAISILRRWGSTDVLRWVAENPHDSKVEGSYLLYRNALRGIYERARLDESKWAEVTQALKHNIEPETRLDALAGLVRASGDHAWEGNHDQVRMEIDKALGLADYQGGVEGDEHVTGFQPIIRPDLSDITTDRPLPHEGATVEVRQPDGTTREATVLSTVAEGDHTLSAVRYPDGQVHRYVTGSMLATQGGMNWTRHDDGYESGRAKIYDNGGGLGPSKGSGRWAVEVDGKWVANVDTLAAAKQRAADELDPRRYRPQPDADTHQRIAALHAIHGEDSNEIAATLVDEDEEAYPGRWAETGFDRSAAISEYLWAIGKFEGSLPVWPHPIPADPPKLRVVAPGVYDSEDGRITMYRIPGLKPPAWNVEWTTDYSYKMSNSEHAESEALWSNLVDGAGSMKMALDEFRAAWPETRAAIQRIEDGYARGAGRRSPGGERGAYLAGGALVRDFTVTRDEGSFEAFADASMVDDLVALGHAGFVTAASHSGLAVDHPDREPSNYGSVGYVAFPLEPNGPKRVQQIERAAERAGLDTMRGDVYWRPAISVYNTRLKDGTTRAEARGQANRIANERVGLAPDAPRPDGSGFLDWLDIRNAEMRRIEAEHGGPLQATDAERAAAWRTFFDELHGGLSRASPGGERRPRKRTFTPDDFIDRSRPEMVFTPDGSWANVAHAHPDEEVQARIDATLASIDSVHKVTREPDEYVPTGPFPFLVYTMEDGSQGSYGSALTEHRTLTPVFIRLEPGSTRPEVTTAHEWGHFIDQQFFGMGMNWGSTVADLNPAQHVLGPIMEALDQTPEIQQIRSHIGHDLTLNVTVNGERKEINLLDYEDYHLYLLRPHEQFARAYAQWIALRSLNRPMMEQIDSEAGGTLMSPTQWTRGNFAPVAQAFDAVFERMGWLREEHIMEARIPGSALRFDPAQHARDRLGQWADMPARFTGDRHDPATTAKQRAVGAPRVVAHVAKALGGTVVEKGSNGGRELKAAVVELPDGVRVTLGFAVQEYHPRQRAIIFYEFAAEPKNTGAGSRVMEALKDFSDETGLPLVVHIAATNAIPFYSKFQWLHAQNSYGRGETFEYRPWEPVPGRPAWLREADYREVLHPRGRLGRWVESMHRLHEIKRDDVIAGRVPGFKYDPDISPGVAAHMRSHEHVTLGPGAFREMGEERDRTSSWLMAHEIGHVVGGRIIARDDLSKIPEVQAFRGEGQAYTRGSGYIPRYENPFGASPRPEEMLADAYSQLLHYGFRDPSWEALPGGKVKLPGHDGEGEVQQVFRVKTPFEIAVEYPDGTMVRAPQEDAEPVGEPESEGGRQRLALLKLVAEVARELGLPAHQLYRRHGDGWTAIQEADYRETLHPRDRLGRWRGKVGLPRLDLKTDRKLTKPMVQSRVQKVADALIDFYGGDKVKAIHEPEYLADVGSDARFRHEGEILPGLLYGARAHDHIADPDFGVEWFRVIAHEAAHSLSGNRPGPMPGVAQTVEEGAAEILSLWFWKHRGQEFDERDATRHDGAWTKPGLESLVHHVAYREWTEETLLRAASKVGWDRGAIVDEVERVMRGNHYDRIRFRDDTTVDVKPPDGVGKDAVSLMRWLLSGD